MAARGGSGLDDEPEAVSGRRVSFSRNRRGDDLALGSECLSSSAGVFDAFEARSWKSHVKRQRDKGMEFVIGRREGVHLWDLESTRRVIDCGTGGGVHSLGHRHPEILAALRRALDDGLDAGLWSVPNAEYVRLQDTLARLSPHAQLNRALITLSSTASVDVAVMFAMRFTGRRKVVAYRHGYHGHSGFAALVTGSLEEGVIGHYNLPTAHAAFFESYGDLAQVEQLLADDVAAFIMELMDYESFAPAATDFVNGVARLCKERGILLIIDETRTGLGRTGRLWASEHHGVAADMMVTGKGLSGGLYPVSALLTREDIYDHCMNTHRYPYISSLGGNEISCIVGNAVLNVASRPQFLEHAARMGRALKERLDALAARHSDVLAPGIGFGCIATVRVKNMVLAKRLYRALFEKGVLAHSVSQIAPVSIKLFPPLVLAETDVEDIARALEDAVREIA